MPSGIWATDGTFSDKVVVSWGPVTGATSYKLYRGTTSNKTSINQIWSNITNTYYWDTSVDAWFHYYYWVTSCDSHGCRMSETGPDSGYRTEPRPTPTDTVVPTPEPTPTASNTARPSTPTPSNTPRPTATRTATLSVSVTPWSPSAWLYLPLVMRD